MSSNTDPHFTLVELYNTLHSILTNNPNSANIPVYITQNNISPLNKLLTISATDHYLVISG